MDSLVSVIIAREAQCLYVLKEGRIATDGVRDRKELIDQRG